LISRPRPDDRLREEANPLRETDDLLSWINVIWPVQSCVQKDSASGVGQITFTTPPSCPTEGRFAIVTDAGQDAVDADAPITNGAKADGEVVWS
jgi:hypothetical protein